MTDTADAVPSWDRRWLLAGPLALAAVVFAALGVWQFERRAWKLDLIARVETRLGAEPAPLPGPGEWPGLTRAGTEYRRVTMRGRFSHRAETRVLAVTELGAGFWVLTPLVTEDAVTVLVNRGFVPQAHPDSGSRPEAETSGPVTVTGLLRWTEPGGAFLRSNDPAADRWYSRDVAAIAAARGLEQVAPFFVDAEAAADPAAWPRGGLTVVAFRNTHLVYALTWLALAAMAAAGAGFILRGGRSGS